MKIIDPADPKPALIFGLNLLCHRFFGYICQIFCPKTFQFQALLRLVEIIKPFPLDFHFPVTGLFKMLFTYTQLGDRWLHFRYKCPNINHSCVHGW